MEVQSIPIMQNHNILIIYMVIEHSILSYCFHMANSFSMMYFSSNKDDYNERQGANYILLVAKCAHLITCVKS